MKKKESRRLKVLVFPFGTEIANEIVQSLLNHKTFRTVLASSDIRLIQDDSKNTVHWLPFVTEESFEAEFHELVHQQQISFVIPAHDDAALILSALPPMEGCQIIGQSRQVNEIVRFKDQTYAALANLVDVPTVHIATRQFDYPIFVKPKRGQGSKNAFKVSTQEELEAFRNKYQIDDFVITEYLEGPEFTIDCFSSRGNLLFAGPRTRELTTNGISARSRPVDNEGLRSQLESTAQRISDTLGMHGLWFFQAKLDGNEVPKLLEIGSRVAGTMGLNRVRGVNFVELALYQALGYDVHVQPQFFDVCVTRQLERHFHHDIEYKSLYVDFDDTLFLDANTINTDVMMLVFTAKNLNKRVFLITRNTDNNLASTLNRFGISSLFDGIHHLSTNESKASFLSKNDLLVDDSFSERTQAIAAGAIAIGLDSIELFAH